jgi:hypothetical protein
MIFDCKGVPHSVGVEANIEAELTIAFWGTYEPLKDLVLLIIILPSRYR